MDSKVMNARDFLIQTSYGKRLVTQVAKGTKTYEAVARIVAERTRDTSFGEDDLRLIVTRTGWKGGAGGSATTAPGAVGSGAAVKKNKPIKRLDAASVSADASRVPPVRLQIKNKVCNLITAPTAEELEASRKARQVEQDAAEREHRRKLVQMAAMLSTRVAVIQSNAHSTLANHFAMTIISIAKHLQETASAATFFMTLFKHVFERTVMHVFQYRKSPELANVRNWQGAFLNSFSKFTKPVTYVPRLNFENVVTSYNYDVIPDSVLLPTMYVLQLVAMQYAAGELVNSKDRNTKKAFRALKSCVPTVSLQYGCDYDQSHVAQTFSSGGGGASAESSAIGGADRDGESVAMSVAQTTSAARMHSDKENPSDDLDGNVVVETADDGYATASDGGDSKRAQVDYDEEEYEEEEEDEDEEQSVGAVSE